MPCSIDGLSISQRLGLSGGKNSDVERDYYVGEGKKHQGVGM
jgi:hypothetical protein